MSTATEDPAVEHEEPAVGEPPHQPDEPLSYLLLTPDDAHEARMARIRELEREHYRLGLHVEEGERTPALLRERNDLIRLARHHAVVLGLVDAPSQPAPDQDGPEVPEGPATAPLLPELPDGTTEPADGPREGPEE